MSSTADDSRDLTATEAVEAGLDHHGAGQLAQAEALYRRALDLEPEDADALHLLGVIAQQRGDYQGAVDLITRAIAADASFAGYHNNLGEAYRRLGKFDEAERAYRQAIALQPDFPEPHNNLGMILQKRRQVNEAIDLYRRAIQLSPNFAEAYNNLGTTLMEKGLISEAVAAYQKALQLKRNYADAYSNLGFALGVQGAYDAAIESCERAVAANPDHHEAYRHMAALYDRKNERAKAEEAYRQALRCRPDSEETRYYLAAMTESNAPPVAPSGYVKLLFDNYAPTFDAHLAGALRYRAPQLIHEAIVAVKPPGKLDVLDLGCGTGLSGVALRPLAASLVGVDLSPRMIEKARQRNIYDQLLVADLTSAMEALGRKFDLIAASDVFVYIGDLAPTFRAAADAIKPAGLFAFSVEVEDQADAYVLHRTRRYSHSLKYLRRLSEDHGFTEVSVSRKALRMERNKNVDGWIVILRARSQGA